jgi:SNF2 family DNA or RNA helicase
VIEVGDGEIALFLNGVIEKSDVMLLNALNFKKVKSKYAYLVSPDTVVNDSMSEYAEKVLKSLQDERDFLLLMENELPESKINKLVCKINTLENNMKADISRGDTKIDKLHELAINSIKPNPSSKWIFFSDDDAILDIVGDILKKQEIVYTSMDNGTLESTEKSLDYYKVEQKCQVLFINSMRDGCGLNLENTTHIVFLHSINPNMLQQVIGRAQRPGRTSTLNIIYLYHQNEMVVPSI